MKKKILVAVALAFSGVVVAQVVTLPPEPPRPPGFGGPLPGLAPSQVTAFFAGRAEFTETESPETGLGPIFNGRSCLSCHGNPAPGGSSTLKVTRFGRITNGVFDPLAEKGGSLLQEFAIDPAVREVVPPEANVVAQRQTTPIFGAGLIEAIADETIVAGAARDKPDGVRGRAAIIVDIATGAHRVGRFGWKAQHATLLSFSADAYLNEMGITNRFFPKENAPNGNAALLAAFDHVADPEDAVDPATGRSTIDALADFMRFLAPPPRATITPSARAGEAQFMQLGCNACHTPVMTTAKNAIPALSEKPVNLYSDLLLHDMGALNDRIAQAAAGMNEMKTPPLWGLRISAPYLHDGRAGTLDQAIRFHDGEGRRARDRYNALPPEQRQQLVDFLNTL